MPSRLCVQSGPKVNAETQGRQDAKLPPYWPELNAQERIWNYTRKHATHNRYFDSPTELYRTLCSTFENVRRHPDQIRGLMQPFL